VPGKRPHPASPRNRCCNGRPPPLQGDDRSQVCKSGVRRMKGRRRKKFETVLKPGTMCHKKISIFTTHGKKAEPQSLGKKKCSLTRLGGGKSVRLPGGEGEEGNNLIVFEGRSCEHQSPRIGLKGKRIRCLRRGTAEASRSPCLQKKRNFGNPPRPQKRKTATTPQ